MVSILEPLRLVHRTHSSTKQPCDYTTTTTTRGQARILLCDVGRFFENAPLGRKEPTSLRISQEVILKRVNRQPLVVTLLWVWVAVCP